LLLIIARHQLSGHHRHQVIVTTSSFTTVITCHRSRRHRLSSSSLGAHHHQPHQSLNTVSVTWGHQSTIVNHSANTSWHRQLAGLVTLPTIGWSGQLISPRSHPSFISYHTITNQSFHTIINQSMVQFFIIISLLPLAGSGLFVIINFRPINNWLLPLILTNVIHQSIATIPISQAIAFTIVKYHRHCLISRFLQVQLSPSGLVTALLIIVSSSVVSWPTPSQLGRLFSLAFPHQLTFHHKYHQSANTKLAAITNCHQLPH